MVNLLDRSYHWEQSLRLIQSDHIAYTYVELVVESLYLDTLLMYRSYLKCNHVV